MPEGAAKEPCPTCSVPLRWRLAALLLVIITVLAALYAARVVMLPIALAFVLSFLLAPVIRFFHRLHVPPTISAAFVLLGFMAFVVGTLSLLVGPAGDWIERVPRITAQVQERLQEASDAFNRFTRATERVEELASGVDREEVPVTVRGPGLRGFILARTWETAGNAAVMLFLLYFLLASGDLFLRKLVHVLHGFGDKRIAVSIARKIQHDVSRYLLTITLINACLGLVVAAVMYSLGMPNPSLWGVMAGMLNYVPYLGPAVTLTVLSTVSLLTFDDLGAALLGPAAFLTLTTLEGQLITPYVLGRRLMLNPVVIFISLILWGWIWGIAGALLAVPLTMIVKIVCDAVPPLAPAGEFLSR